MKQAERLSVIVDELRPGEIRRAADLRRTVNVTERTIYHDIDTLRAAGVPIESERGLGFMLRRRGWTWPLATETSTGDAR
jgi:predicted DNA-binding transcriptional regulator YafY